MSDLDTGPAPVDYGGPSSLERELNAKIKKSGTDFLDAGRAGLAEEWRGEVEEKRSS
jgi:hypothetical protein